MNFTTPLFIPDTLTKLNEEVLEEFYSEFDAESIFLDILKSYLFIVSYLMIIVPFGRVFYPFMDNILIIILILVNSSSTGLSIFHLSLIIIIFIKYQDANIYGFLIISFVFWIIYCVIFLFPCLGTYLLLNF